MPVNIATQARNAAGSAIVALLDQGSNNANGYMEIRTGTKPPNPQMPTTGTLLATFSFSNPAFGAFGNGTALANSMLADTNVANDGIAGWFRCYNRDGIAIFDGDVSLTGGGGDIEFDNINFSQGGTAQIISLSSNMPM